MKQKTCEIIGGTTNIEDVDEYIRKTMQYAEKNHVHIQLFNAKMISGKTHLELALSHALRAIQERRMTTQSLEMEILLYASGERQLKHAIPKIGVKPGKSWLAIIFITNADNEDGLYDLVDEYTSRFKINRDDAVLKASKKKIIKWGISEKEIQTLKDKKYEELIFERIAMVDVIK
jgi:tRNA threonylcarbamoyladenosine modification (KEOPS) complex Cgi121 subunit